MLKRTLAAATVALIAGAFSVGATSVPTNAAMMYGTPTLQSAPDSNIQLAATTVVKKKTVIKKKKGKTVKTTTTVKRTKNVTRYSANRHGKRYRHREGAYVYYYDGYYYQQPWWTLAVPGVNLCIGC